MAQNDLVFPYFSIDIPMWEPEQMPAFLAGLASRHRVTRGAPTGGGGGIAAFGASINAFARIIVPPDPDVPGDHGAGEGSFHSQVIRLIEGGTVSDLGAEITLDDAHTVFAELNAHAQADFGRHTFAQLTGQQQQQLVDALLAATLVPLTVSGPDAAIVLQSLGRLILIIVKIAHWTNFPEHRVRSGPLGFGSGHVIFSDPRNQISNPNTPGTGTAWDYLGWHYPIRKGVEDKLALAFLEADVAHHAAQSEAALADLLARDAARTLINHD